MKRTNIARLNFEYDDSDPDGFRSGMARFGPAFGAEQTGTSVYEIPPGWRTIGWPASTSSHSSSAYS